MEKRTCYHCLYSDWALSRWARSLWSGMPVRPTCTNHPDAPGERREVNPGVPCRNYRPRPAAADPRQPARDPSQAGSAPHGPQRPPPEAIREIPLTRGKVALVDAHNFERLNQHRWSCRGGGNPYAARFEGNKVIWMHREIMHTPEGMVVDHIDGNGLNNLEYNLRNCTHEQNVHNLSKAAHGSSIYKGVWKDKHKEKWYAKICHKGIRYYLGTFYREEEAARAYDRKAVELFGIYARLNFPDEWPPERRQAVYDQQAGAEDRQQKPGDRPDS